MRKNPGFKIILGLLFPPTISHLEFKTKEELELMPQTEEEAQDRDDSDSNSSRSSSRSSSRRSSIRDSLSSLECGAEPSIVSGKRKRVRSGFRTDRTDRTDTEAEESHLNNKIYYSNSSLNEPDEEECRDGLLINDFPNTGRIDYTAKKKTRPLKLRKKLYEFYAAPISKYFSHSVSLSIPLCSRNFQNVKLRQHNVEI